MNIFCCYKEDYELLSPKNQPTQDLNQLISQDYQKKQNSKSITQNFFLAEAELYDAESISIQKEDENFENLDFLDQKESPKLRLSLSHFHLLKAIGQGALGKVYLVEKINTQQLFAMKILNKTLLMKKNQRSNIKNERIILEQMNSPFITRLHYAFQNQENLFMVLDFQQGGELFFHLRNSFKFSEQQSKFYAVEIIIALDHLHKNGVIYRYQGIIQKNRDLKPENILLGSNGHIKLVDFGIAKLNSSEDKTYSFCGTPEYLAPEILLCNQFDNYPAVQGHNKTVDWWSLGALLFQMLAGVPPFFSKSKTQMFKNQLEKDVEIKPWFSENATDLLNKLLCRDPKLRLGSKGTEEIKMHPFFDEIDWAKFEKLEVQPLIIPELTHDRDLRYFDKFFTENELLESPSTDFQILDHYPQFSYSKQINLKNNVKPEINLKRMNFPNQNEFSSILYKACYIIQLFIISLTSFDFTYFNYRQIS